MSERDQLLHNQEVKVVNHTDQNVLNYSNYGIEGTSLLAFRDVPNLINKHVVGKKTLDYGCGSGRSTRFLQSLGLNVVGADINDKFLNACNDRATTHYCKIENDKLPFVNNSYDFVFSSLVFLAISTKKGVVTALREIHRVLKEDGIFILVTGTEKLHSPEMQWVSYRTDFPENRNPISGKKIKIFIKSARVTFYDYFWSNEDYLELFPKCGFQLLETRLPLGNKQNDLSWLSEKENAPFIIYVLKRIRPFKSIDSRENSV